MGKFDGKFESKRQDWETPWDFFKPILSGDWWHIKVEGKEGHACQKCKDEYEKKPKGDGGRNE